MMLTHCPLSIVQIVVLAFIVALLVLFALKILFDVTLRLPPCAIEDNLYLVDGMLMHIPVMRSALDKVSSSVHAQTEI